MFGRYPNTINSHIIGKFGEIAVNQAFASAEYQTIPHFRGVSSFKLCDVEVAGGAPYPRIEVKTWNASNWPALGRCVEVKQAPKIRDKADAIVWCTVPLPYLRSQEQLEQFDSLPITLVGFSTLPDVFDSPVRLTGKAGARKVENHQLDNAPIRPVSALFFKKS